ncbi:hypothetical protein ADL26_20885 [Thermoactinomyces vulgaris]|nr:hypothetical protein ADL26_20885 [Thermoactinomyces vulgaris]
MEVPPVVGAEPFGVGAVEVLDGLGVTRHCRRHARDHDAQSSAMAALIHASTVARHSCSPLTRCQSSHESLETTPPACVTSATTS